MTISRGRKGVKIFTSDKIQLRENVARSGDRTLALDMAQDYFHKIAASWGNEVARSLKLKNTRHMDAEPQAEREKPRKTITLSFSVGQSESLKQTEIEAQKMLRQPRQRQNFKPRQNIQRNKGIRI